MLCVISWVAAERPARPDPTTITGGPVGSPEERSAGVVAIFLVFVLGSLVMICLVGNRINGD